MPSKQLPVIKDGELTKTKLTGKYVLRGTCPACGVDLSLTQAEVLKAKDSCPDCGVWFAVGLPELRKAQALHVAAEKAKEQAKLDRDERRTEQRRVAEEAAAVRLQNKNEAAAVKQEKEAAELRKQRQLAAQNEANERNKVAIQISELAETAKLAGFEGSDERFPNLAKVIRWCEQIVHIIMCLFGLVVLGLVFATVGFFNKQQELEAIGAIVGIGVTAGVAMFFYVICMALIELYKVLISIEDSTRKNNTLVAAQIDLMGKLAENTNY
jgi:Zn-finger nucleic acid-binding protein